MILLDSSVLVSLQDLLLPDEPWAFSVIAYSELAFGARLPVGPAVQAQRREQIAWLDRIGLEWLPFDQAAADGYAVVAAQVHKTRKAHARSKDMMLAGHAYALGAGLATLNPRDFDLVSDLVPIIVPAPRPRTA
jgi:predicted nucleic acid-binding protein